MWNRLKSSKTVWTSVGAILVAVGSYLTNQMELQDTIEAVIIGILFIFTRDGIAKNVTKPTG